MSISSYEMGFRVRDCSGNPFVFFLKKTKDCSGKPDPQGHALLTVVGSLYIVYCIMYIDDVDNRLELVVWFWMIGVWDL